MQASDASDVAADPAATARLVIEVHRSTDPIEGRLWAVGGHPVAFAGWLGLFASLETALAADGDPPDPASRGDDK